MADNFNLRAFLAENKLTKNAQLLNERDTSRPGTDFDFIQGPEGDPLVSKVLGYLEQNYEEGVDFEYDPNMQRLAIYGDLAEDGELVDLIDDVVTQPEYEDNLEEADWRNNPFTPHNFDGVARQAQQSKELQATANRMFPEFGGELKDLGAPLTPDQRNAVWATWSKEKTQKESMNSKKQDMKETNLTAKERRLVEMVNSAMGYQEDEEQANDIEQAQHDIERQYEGSEMSDETVIPEYNTIDELMNSIDHGTNKVAEEHKMQEMKKIAQMLREKAKKMEESEHAAHISPKDLKQLANDAAKLEKAAEKLKAAFDKKFNKKEKPASAAKAEKVEALQENRMENFNLKKFLVENKLTTNSRMLNEELKFIDATDPARNKGGDQHLKLSDLVPGKTVIALNKHYSNKAELEHEAGTFIEVDENDYIRWKTKDGKEKVWKYFEDLAIIKNL